MAALKDTVVAGSLRATDTLYTTTLQTTKISAPTASNGTTYGLGSNGQILKSNGSSIYWAADNDAGDTKVTQAAVGTAAGTHNILLAATAGNTSAQTTTALKGALTYTPSTKTLAVGGPLTATTGTFSSAVSGTTGTFSGTVTAGTFAANTAQSSEIDVVAQSGAGKIYLYSVAAVNGNRGIYGTNAGGTGAAILTVNQSNQISGIATITASPTITGTLTLSKTTDASGTANNSPALIVGGAATSTHLELDANEIMAKTNGTSVAPLYINNDGGLVTIGSGGLKVAGALEATGAATVNALTITNTNAVTHIKFSRTGNPSYISIPDGETLIALNGTSCSSTSNVILGMNKSNLYSTFGSDIGTSTYYWGNIYTKGYIYTKAANRYPLDIQMKNSSGNIVAEIWYDQGDNTNVTSGVYYFRQFSPNSTASATTTGYKETFNLPAVTAGLTADKNYVILTTKNMSSITTVGTITSGTWNGGKVNGLTLKANTTGFEISGGTTSKKLTVGADYTLAAACAKGVDTSIAAASTSANLPTSAAVATFVEGKKYVTSSGVTSVTISATSPVTVSATGAITTTGTRTIALADGYGDTKNPYAAKAKNLFLAGPSSGDNAAPTFRTIAAADLPAATSSALGAVKTGDGISNSSGTISVAYGTVAKTAAVGNDSRFGKVSTTLATTTKAYLLGVSTAPTATAQNLAAVSDTGVYLDTTAGSLTVSGNLTGKKFTHTTITGTGTVGVAYNATNKVNGVPALWRFNLSTATPTEGDMITITIPVAGHASGVYVSTDNGTTYKPVSTNGTAALTTHFPVGTTITLVYDADGQTNTIYPIAGAAATQNVTGGCWRVLNYYDSNTTPYGIRVYRQTSGYNADYPFLVSRTVASSIGTAGSNSSYANNVYGILWNDTTKTPTVNPSTGAVKAVSYNGLTLTAASTGFTIAGGTTSKTLTVSQNMTLKGGTLNHIAYFDANNSLVGHPTAAIQDIDKTDTSAGVSQLALGNKTLWTETDGKAGLLNLYSLGSYGTRICSDYNTTEWYTATLQAKTGTIAYIDDVATVLNCGTISSLPTTINNTKITDKMVVLNSVLSNPSAQLSNWTVTTANGSVTISGSIKGSTNVTLYLSAATQAS